MVPFVIESVDHIVLNVTDVEESAAWYVRILGMQRIEFSSRTGTRVALRFGNQKINLRPRSADTAVWFTGASPVSGSADLCFVVTVRPEDVKEYWLSQGVAVETGPVLREGTLGPVTSVYCRDPDGNLIELASYRIG